MIDGVVDGTAYSVHGFRRPSRRSSRPGRIQTYIGLSLFFFFAILLAGVVTVLMTPMIRRCLIKE